MIVIQTAQLLKHSPASVCLDNDFPVYYTRKSLIQFSVCCALNGKYLYTQIVYMCMSNFQLSEYPLIIVTSHYFSFSFPPSLPFPFPLPSSPTPTPTLPLSPSLSPQVTNVTILLYVSQGDMRTCTVCMTSNAATHSPTLTVYMCFVAL